MKLVLYILYILKVGERFEKAIATEVWELKENRWQQVYGFGFQGYCHEVGSLLNLPPIEFPVASPATFFSLESATQFNNWWSLKRFEDGRISYKVIYPSKEQLLDKLGLTGDLFLRNFQVVQVRVVNQSLIEVKQLEDFFSGFSWYKADWDDNVDLALQACQSANPDAAIALLGLMQMLSQRLYHAAWVTGNGSNLWTLIQSEYRYNLSDISPSEIDKLISLRDVCVGWWEFDNELKFWSIEEWKRQYRLN